MAITHRFAGWSGTLLRWLMAYLFVVGLFGTVYAALYLHPLAIYGVALMVPYLVIRYRDPESTTLPLSARVRRPTR